VGRGSGNSHEGGSGAIEGMKRAFGKYHQVFIVIWNTMLKELVGHGALLLGGLCLRTKSIELLTFFVLLAFPFLTFMTSAPSTTCHKHSVKLPCGTLVIVGGGMGNEQETNKLSSVPIVLLGPACQWSNQAARQRLKHDNKARPTQKNHSTGRSSRNFTLVIRPNWPTCQTKANSRPVWTIRLNLRSPLEDPFMGRHAQDGAMSESKGWTFRRWEDGLFGKGVFLFPFPPSFPVVCCIYCY
jgi:hypothetical protein